MGLINKNDRYSVNSSTNNQYIFILPQHEQHEQQQQQQKFQNFHFQQQQKEERHLESTTTTIVGNLDDDVDCSSRSSNHSSDCESIPSERTATPTDSSTSMISESPSKVWRPW